MDWKNVLANGITAGELQRSLSDPFYGINKEQLYYACVELLFYVIILIGILWQFRRNGKKIKLLESRIANLEKKS